MQVQYYPKRKNSWDTTLLRPTGFVVAMPNNNVPKPWKLMIAIHGVGERSAGTIENLENLWLGFDYGDGKRVHAFVLPDMKEAVDKYGIVLMIPTYDGNEFFEPAKVNELYDWARANTQIHDKMLLTGFSLGGGAVFKYISSSLSNAQRVAYAIPCAAVNSLGDATLPGKAQIAVHAFSNDKDPTVNVSNTNTQIDKINASNPSLRAVRTIFRRDGHGSNERAWSLEPPTAPGGQGFTDAGENIYDVFSDIIKTGKPRQMRKAGEIIVIPPTTIAPPDIPPTTKPPVSTILADAGEDQTVNLPTAFLDGTKSIGYKSAKWIVKQVPEGVSIWDPIVVSGGWITTKLNLPKEGTYVFTLRVFSENGYQGLISEDDVVVNYTTTGAPPAKILLQAVYVPKIDKTVYVYDDGTIETK